MHFAFVVPMGPKRSEAATEGSGVRLHPGIGGAQATPQNGMENPAAVTG